MCAGTVHGKMNEPEKKRLFHPAAEVSHGTRLIEITVMTLPAWHPAATSISRII
jgi:hypothetical protein